MVTTFIGRQKFCMVTRGARLRVHPEFLAKAKLPPKLAGKNIWEERFEDIRNFEQYRQKWNRSVQILSPRFKKKNRNGDSLMGSKTH